MQILYSVCPGFTVHSWVTILSTQLFIFCQFKSIFSYWCPNYLKILLFLIHGFLFSCHSTISCYPYIYFLSNKLLSQKKYILRIDKTKNRLLKLFSIINVTNWQKKTQIQAISKVLFSSIQATAQNVTHAKIFVDPKATDVLIKIIISGWGF